jgi:hypothetical protein
MAIVSQGVGHLDRVGTLEAMAARFLEHGEGIPSGCVRGARLHPDPDADARRRAQRVVRLLDDDGTDAAIGQLEAWAQESASAIGVSREA